ncbi:glycosyltransferase family 2 protein [Butyrivibrio sp. FC2001]|uniref:glycosyltransferase family 2 protein n=1 Tax=Butyrivibrio sp. FC2001 TaxID=1280671 RepID=UPI000402563F|nr:glycosyltransferase family 2 protein [Butyrivibrio sp. FC2001]
MDKKVSVIVPVYKAEKFIDRCIRSIIGQTYENLEILLVDDGSPDRSGEICDSYAQKDERVKVLHQENMGQSEARNNAIKIATGDYYVFMDADDMAPAFMVANLLKYCEKDSSQICIGDFRVFKDEFTCEDAECINNNAQVYKGSDIIPLMHTVPGEKYVVMWGKIFKAELFEGIEFPKGRICEDLAVLYKLYDRAEKVALIDHVVYGYYRGNEDSSTFSLSDRFYRDVYVALDEELAYVAEHHPDMICYPAKTYMYWLFDEYRKLFNKKSDKARRKDLFNRYCQMYKKVAPLKIDKFYHFFRYAPGVYCMIKNG